MVNVVFEGIDCVVFYEYSIFIILIIIFGVFWFVFVCVIYVVIVFWISLYVWIGWCVIVFEFEIWINY